ncbi:MAG: PP2C family serine/threonine-protein phosphatase [Lachnospiraceae bacterium]|nr:PP2C family serine/threonine-protein phosphatase [Lachnospiraceae bacterium]
MQFLTAAISDVGIKKKVNQDAVLVKIASSGYGRIGLAAICDGMGGLSNGELASATMLRGIEEWFGNILPQKFAASSRNEEIYESLLAMLRETDKKLKDYIRQNGEQLGTTVSILLLTEEEYFIFYVGDTRIYLHDGMNLRLLSKDHTYVQQEIDNGRMTEEEAENSSERSVLLQCVGASAKLEPDYISGRISAKSVFLVCSDGFRHVLSKKELQKALSPKGFASEKKMEDRLRTLVKTIKQRGEEDNISAVLMYAL